MPAADPARARLAAWMFQELPAFAGPWLATQRWFGGKARTIAGVAVEDVVWLADDGAPTAVVALLVDYAPAPGGPPPQQERYVLVAGVATSDGPTAIAPLPEGEDRYLTEVATVAPSIGALLAPLSGGGERRGERGAIVRGRDATPAARRLAAAPLPAVVPVGVEQSNTSVRIGDGHVFKLFRRLEDGESPQLEFGRFLAAVDFGAAPRLEGSLEYAPPRGRGCALGTLETWVPNQGDGWRHILTRLGAAGAIARDLANPLAGELAQLGAVTADFHAALASRPSFAAFAPAPVTADDVRVWHLQAATQGERTMALLARPQPAWPPEVAALARAVLAAGPRLAAAVSAAGPSIADGFDKIRIHGDFHLGQTLRTDAGFTIIDFEGEPSKPLAERRRTHCALKDVAGMLRSLDYAAATVGDGGAPEGSSARMAAQMRAAYLDAYYAAADRHRGRFLPAGAAARAAWTGLFEVEKALYEVDYELNNRPSWVPIPLAALVRLLGAG
jgi:maltose alpha-D-glucosyltransferase/alpha-amylase